MTLIFLATFPIFDVRLQDNLILFYSGASINGLLVTDYLNIA